MHTSPRRCRRGLAAAAALAPLLALGACGAETSPPRHDIGHVVPKRAPDVATLSDCLDTTRHSQVTSCPYPVQSGHRASSDHHRRHW
jgi:hypothetical protein